MNVIGIIIAFALGFAARGWLDSVTHSIVTRVLTSAIGKEKVAAAMVKYLGERPK